MTSIDALAVDSLSPDNAALAKTILAEIKTKLAEIPPSKDDTKLRLMVACAFLGVCNLVALLYWALLPPAGDLKRLD